MNYLSTAIKHAVSQNRCRFVDSHYDLDLTYITNRIIAMGFPGDGLRSLYRNNGVQIAAFLHQYHPNHFMIFNLSQLEYDKDKFDNNVMLMGWPDHHNPTLDLLFSIVKTMHAWLHSDPNNVVAVHCLAGKGRTGTVIVCYLLYIGMFETVREALEYFAMKRTSSHNVDRGVLACVDSPSQVTYIDYFHRMITKQVNHDDVIESKPVHLDMIYLYNVPPVLLNAIELGKFRLTVNQMTTLGPNDTRLVNMKTMNRPQWRQTGFSNVLAFHCENLELHKDIVIVCKIVNTLSVEEVFRFAFHTAFVTEERLKKDKFMMDHSLKNALIPDEFLVDVVFKSQSSDVIAPNLLSEQETQISDGSVGSVNPPQTIMSIEQEPSQVIQDSQLISTVNPETQIQRNLYTPLSKTKAKLLLNHQVADQQTIISNEEPLEGEVIGEEESPSPPTLL